MVRPVMAVVKAPVVPVAVCFVSAVVGLAEVEMTVPRSVMVEPPSEVTLPLPVAVVAVIAVTAWVVTVGAVATV